MPKRSPALWEAIPGGTIRTADTHQIVADLYAGGLGDWRSRAQMEEEGRLIAAAPAMLDMLLELEWSGTDTYDGLDIAVCPICEGADPGHRHAPPMYLGHFDDCRLDALITQAGGRSS